MARISDDLVVQLVGEDLIVADDQEQEIRIRYQHITRFLLACEYLRAHAGCYDPEQVARETAQVRADEARVQDQIQRRG